MQSATDTTESEFNTDSYSNPLGRYEPKFYEYIIFGPAFYVGGGCLVCCAVNASDAPEGFMGWGGGGREREGEGEGDGKGGRGEEGTKDKIARRGLNDKG